MSVTKGVVYEGGLQRQVMPGDVVALGETIQPLVTVGAGTLLANLLLAGIIRRTGPTAGYIDTTDSAANIVAALSAYYQTGVQPGTTLRCIFINTVAFANTMAAGSNVTLTNGTVNASSVKEFLITITNGTPTRTYSVIQTNSSAVITGMTQAQTDSLSVGMAVSGTGVSGTVISVQTGIGVTLSANASTTSGANQVTFNPTVSIDGLGQGLL